MPDTDSKGDFLMFRETLAELECLVDVRVKSYLLSGRAGTAINDGFFYMLNLLTELDVNTSESNAIDELERLAEVRSRQISSTEYFCLTEKRNTSILDKMIDSKINFINKGSISRVDSKYGVDPMVALERLAARSIQSDTASSHKTATVSHQVSETQENSKHDLSTQSDDSMTTTKFISSPSSWLQDQDSVRDNEDNGSTIDGGELTPTSTILSEFPDPNGG